QAQQPEAQNQELGDADGGEQLQTLDPDVADESAFPAAHHLHDPRETESQEPKERHQDGGRQHRQQQPDRDGPERGGPHPGVQGVLESCGHGCSCLLRGPPGRCR
ncbi:hypothetical protein RZS08_51050, partial [Arthrospira platensis SPKY1]|nr:hypothetical protein [Arthrospira platensis SPKY1]